MSCFDVNLTTELCHGSFVLVPMLWQGHFSLFFCLSIMISNDYKELKETENCKGQTTKFITDVMDATWSI